MKAYFLGGNILPWYVLGISNASGMFDISGTMLLVYWMFVYGLKSVWIPWLWPTFNQIFLMVLSLGVAATFQCDDRRRVDSRPVSVRAAALNSRTSSSSSMPSSASSDSSPTLSRESVSSRPTSCPGTSPPMNTPLILMGITTFYVIKGGMFSVVITEVIQFCILSIASFAVGIIAMMRMSPPEMLQSVLRRPVGINFSSVGTSISTGPT